METVSKVEWIMTSWHDSNVLKAAQYGTDFVPRLFPAQKAFVGAGFIPAYYY